jgi:hypothetical protein
MFLAHARLLECLAAARPASVIRNAFRAVFLNTVTLDVPQVQLGSLRAASRKPHDAGLDDDTPSATQTSAKITGASWVPSVAPVTTAHQRQDGVTQR